MDENTIICRCSDVTLKDIRDLIAQGYVTYAEIKRITRVGMGPCQGRTCKEMVAREVAAYLHKSVEEVDIPVSRIPIKPITLGQINELNGGV